MDNDYPTFGSRWKHHSGRIYTVLGTANTRSPYVSGRYPISVVYVGYNGYLWTKLLNNFLETMTKINPGE